MERSGKKTWKLKTSDFGEWNTMTKTCEAEKKNNTPK